ncbi:MAG TPA: hypothetical protein VM681_08380 [Candidatus Thermoplasmatota archaeon]|nr:hypothetical protein [Candidatus Thermoplasmatota archaeon]
MIGTGLGGPRTAGRWRRPLRIALGAGFAVALCLAAAAPPASAFVDPAVRALCEDQFGWQACGSCQYHVFGSPQYFICSAQTGPVLCTVGAHASTTCVAIVFSGAVAEITNVYGCVGSPKLQSGECPCNGTYIK